MKGLWSILQWSGLLLYTAADVSDVAAQERQVRGIVYEINTEGEQTVLPGVLVQTPDGQQGTQSLADGAFRLMVPETATALVFSFPGYENDTVAIPRGEEPMQVALRQPRQLGEVLVTGRQESTHIGMLEPIQTHHIGERELMKAACCNLSESFETTPSIDAAYTDAVTGYRQIQMLGLTGPYTLITRENIPDIRGLAAITGLTFTPGTWVESMQLSKGTGSVVNGYESVAGQLNVELRKPFEDERWLFNLYQNTQGRSEGNIVYRKELGKYLSSNLMLHGRSQWMKVDQNGDGFLDQPLGRQFVALNRWFYFGPRGIELQAGIKGTYVDNTGGQWGYSPGMEQVAGNPWGYETGISRAEGWAKIGKIWLDKKWRSVGLQLSGVYHDQDAVYGARGYEAWQRSLYSNLIYQTIIGNTNHVIKGGASFLMDRLGEQFDGATWRREELVPGVFTEYAWSHMDKWNVVAGLRADYHNLFGAFVTPRLHLRYAPAKRTAIRASAGRAQRTANLLAENMGYMASNRRFIVLGADAGKPYGLNPEVAWNTGVNLTQKFFLNYRDGAFAVDYYYTHFQNQVVVDIEDPHTVRFYNLAGQSYAHSFQAQLDYEPVRKWDVRIAYRWYDVKTTYGGILKERPLVAAHRAFLNTGYALKGGWSVDYTVQWISPKRVPATHHAGGPMADYYAPAFVQMNAQITKKWRNNIEVYLGGENLTNYMQDDIIIGRSDPFAPGFDASLIWGPAMGRNVYAGLRYKIR
jgi:outer membrane receptor for ferrienterochelin and colicins